MGEVQNSSFWFSFLTVWQATVLEAGIIIAREKGGLLVKQKNIVVVFRTPFEFLQKDWQPY
jgi:hypothetical protein